MKVSTQLARQLEQMIIAGSLKPGDRVPSERALCAQFDLSRSAVREALQELRGRGLIETRQGQGSRVAALLRLQPQDPILQLFKNNAETLYDLLDVRALLEGRAAFWAASRATAADIRLLEGCYEKMAAVHAADVPVDEKARADLDFHLEIAEAAHNPVLSHTLRALTDLLLTSVYASLNNLYHQASHKRLIDSQHKKLYRAILQGKAVAARRAAEAHIAAIKETLREKDGEALRVIRAQLRLKKHGR